MKTHQLIIISLCLLLLQITFIRALAFHRIEIKAEIKQAKIEIMNETNQLTACLIFHRCPPEHP